MAHSNHFSPAFTPDFEPFFQQSQFSFITRLHLTRTASRVCLSSDVLNHIRFPQNGQIYKIP